VFALAGCLLVAYTCFGILLHAVSVPCDLHGAIASVRDIAAATTEMTPASVLGTDWSTFKTASALRFLGNALFTGLVTAQMLRSVLTNNAVLAYLQGAAALEDQIPGATATLAFEASGAYRFLRFLENLKQLPIDVRLALHNGTYNTRALRLKELQAQLIMPFLREVAVKGLLCSAILAVTLSVTLLGKAVSTPAVLFCGFQCGAYLYGLRCLLCLLYYPYRSSQQAFHNRILNDNYLIGRTLVNNASQVRLWLSVVNSVRFLVRHACEVADLTPAGLEESYVYVVFRRVSYSISCIAGDTTKRTGRQCPDYAAGHLTY
jgi:hypothetical protein